MATIERFLPTNQTDISRPARLREKRNEPPSQSRKKRMVVDPRRVLGSLLILLSLGGGYVTVMKADQRQTYVALAHAMAAGQRIEASDLVEIRAALPSSLYARSKRALIGQALLQSAKAGEVIALSSVVESQPFQLIAIPAKSTNIPTLSRGDRVSLWSAGQMILSNVAVEAIVKESSMQVLTLAVPEDLVAAVIPSLSDDVVVVKLP